MPFGPVDRGSGIAATYSISGRMNARSLRQLTYQRLEVSAGRTGRMLNAALMLLIALNVAGVILESVPGLQRAYGLWFRLFEIFSVVVFSIEYLARIWACAESERFGNGWRGRLRYMLTPMALVDLFAILPFYLGVLIDVDTRFLRALRLLRVFKLARHSTAMDLLLTVVRNEVAIVASSLFIMLIIIVMAASGIYLIEREAQPDAFESIPQAMWWAAVTLTTVGYGDVIPVTVLGKVFGLVITVAGVGMVALPAGILASGFSQELLKRRTEYQLKVKESLADGSISRSDLRELRSKALELGISQEDARMLLQSETTSKPISSRCPHCGKDIS